MLYQHMCFFSPAVLNMKLWGKFAFLLHLLFSQLWVHASPPKVPCYFIFGDSLSDPGNNNDLLTAAKANYFPYGIDFPNKKPTGRFSNGRTVVDAIAQHLGFEEYIPTFSLRGQDILRGVNYASGSAGIQFETGHHLGARISMDKQLQNHILTIGKLAKMMRGSHWRYLEECLYTVTIGNNDYINNYLVPKYYPSSLLYSHQQFAQLLLDQFSFQLQALHGLGARKVAVFGLGLIGCTLAEISRHGASPGSPCVDPINEAVQHFNNGLASLVTRLNANLKDATFTFINSTSIALLTTPHSPGKMVSDIPCCKLREDGQCAKFVPPCHNQDKYVFWDGFHPTEAMNIATAARAYKAQFPTDAYPVDISRLISHTVAAE